MPMTDLEVNMTYYDIYGKIAEIGGLAEATINGRYENQEDAQSNIPGDIIPKLRLDETLSFLDIGCGSGLILEHVSNITTDIHACDHPNVLRNMERKRPHLKANLFPGNFFEITFNRRFDRILAYSVMNSISQDDGMRFINKMLSILAPSGLAIIADIANTDKKARFLQSKRGKIAHQQWLASKSEKDKLDTIFEDNKDLKVSNFIINDQILSDLILNIRTQGFHTCLLDQPVALPFGNSREDLVIMGPEYEYV